MRASILLLPALLGACAAGAADTPPPANAGGGDGEAMCRNEPLQAFVGQTANEALGGKMLAESGARTLRWVPPNTAVTMDFRPDRLTVMYDADYKILSASCG